MAQLKPEDVIVIECDEDLSENQCAYIESSTKRIWPERKVVVMAGGLKLKVVSGAQL